MRCVLRPQRSLFAGFPSPHSPPQHHVDPHRPCHQLRVALGHRREVNQNCPKALLQCRAVGLCSRVGAPPLFGRRYHFHNVQIYKLPQVYLNLLQVQVAPCFTVIPFIIAHHESLRTFSSFVALHIGFLCGAASHSSSPSCGAVDA